LGIEAKKVDIGFALVKIEEVRRYKRVRVFEIGLADGDWIKKGQLRTLTLV
jgi:hypothetical protein